MNGDHNINILDVDLVVQFIIGEGVVLLGVVFFVLVDVNCDGTVNILDVDMVV